MGSAGRVTTRPQIAAALRWLIAPALTARSAAAGAVSSDSSAPTAYTPL